MARTSAFAFKGKEIDIREVGEKLNVDIVLEGSVRKSGQRLRITAQLINVADGYYLWSERFDREMKDIFNIQDEVTLEIVDKLKIDPAYALAHAQLAFNFISLGWMGFTRPSGPFCVDFPLQPSLGTINHDKRRCQGQLGCPTFELSG